MQAAGAAGWCNNTLSGATTGQVANTAVGEASGLAASHLVDDVYRVHNDSGNPAEVYAIGGDGRDLGTWTVGNATNVDWEDIATGPGHVDGVSYLYVADIGGNTAPRTSVVIYRMPEPTVTPATATGGSVDAEAITLTYPDGPHDAEGFHRRPHNRAVVRRHQGRGERAGLPRARQTCRGEHHGTHAGGQRRLRIPARLCHGSRRLTER